MTTPKQLFHLSKENVQWLQSIVDDPRFQHTLVMVEAHMLGNMTDSSGPNQMVIDNAIRIGAHRFRAELLSFGNPVSKPKEWSIPPILHDPDRPASPQ